MSTVKKGVLTHSKEWAKHLRKYWRARFWNGEKMAVKKAIRKELNEG